MSEEYIETRKNNLIKRSPVNESGSVREKKQEKTVPKEKRLKFNDNLDGDKALELLTEIYVQGLVGEEKDKKIKKERERLAKEVQEINFKEKSQADTTFYEEKYSNLSPSLFENFDSNRGFIPTSEDIYIKEMIENDKRKVIEKREEENGKSPEGILLERTFDETMENGFAHTDTFGSPEIIKIHKTTEVDDRFSHTDKIIEWQSVDNSRDFLAIDVTTSDRDEEIFDKCKKIKNEIYKNKLTDIKYFTDSYDKSYPLMMIPRAIVSINGNNLKSLCQEICGDKLGGSNINMNILFQIKRQLEIQLELIEERVNDKSNKYPIEIINIFSEMRKKIEKVLDKINIAYENKTKSLSSIKREKAENDLEKGIMSNYKRAYYS